MKPFSKTRKRFSYVVLKVTRSFCSVTRVYNNILQPRHFIFVQYFICRLSACLFKESNKFFGPVSRRRFLLYRIRRKRLRLTGPKNLLLSKNRQALSLQIKYCTK